MIKIHIAEKAISISQEQFNELIKSYVVIEAAGGLVTNSASEILFIFRLGKWDLPKGKIDPGETTAETALREVSEECGIGGLEIESELIPTYHVYTENGIEYLKKTTWFKMKHIGNETPKPQIEESITEAVWKKPEELLTVTQNSYPAIIDLLKYSLGI